MPSRESRARARRRVIRRRRQVAGGGLLLLVALIVLAGSWFVSALTGENVATVASKSSTPSSTPTTQPQPRASSASTPSQSPSVKVSAEATGVRATGEYTRATGGTDRHGTGTPRTYRVEVETGTRQDAQTFAAAADATLGDPASWAGQGRWSLQRVSSGDADFVIRLATPATVDKVCATAGLDTRGYVSCRAGAYVMINLDRWLKAVPEFGGNVALYRQYLINHEVGHQLGYGHQACPGPGRLAPVMQQQTFGLDGCRANGLPYVDGVLVTGPAVA